MSLFPFCTIQALCCFGVDSPIQFGHKLHNYAFFSFVAPLVDLLSLMEYICLSKETYHILKGVQLYIIKICCIFQIGRPALEFSLDLGPHCCPCWPWILLVGIILLPSDHSVNHSMLQVDLGHWIWILLVGVILLPSYDSVIHSMLQISS